MYRIIAEHHETGCERVLTAPMSDLTNVAIQIELHQASWERRGYSCFAVQDDTLGQWTDMLREHLVGLHKADHIDALTCAVLANHVN